MNKKTPQILIIHTQDIETITGRGNQAVRRPLNKVKKRLGKGPDDLVTIEEFCAFLGLSEEKFCHSRDHNFIEIATQLPRKATATAEKGYSLSPYAAYI